ncbi:Glyoxalase-like domain protein [Planctomycetes bacterium Pla163]|uniref:Glyoxalase-like domain protein n=1 Tax=Rohdeia mirabilis TaxID=2528008 RepID=A0A518CUT0_9BACT|nr:Glyoxalase-like domain protein [Planctomycetes bacterium Pla163]
MLDHVVLQVSDAARSRAFYERALAPLGYAVQTEFPGFVGFGTDRPVFWIAQRGVTSTEVHVALRAADRATVDAFHAAALAAGGRSNGEPGERPHYHPGYYGAFVLDPDGNNIEAVVYG